MSDVNMGTLYDINKTMILKEKPLKIKKINEKLDEITNFCISKHANYYMLLNRENYDFTLFNFGKRCLLDIISIDLKDCLQNRGEILSIEQTENKDAYEIWLKINNEAFAYYFFPYDQGVIE